MMHRIRLASIAVKNSTVLWSAVALLAAFIALAVAIPGNIFIEILNGAFVGAGVTVAWAFAPLLWKALWDKEGYDRVRMMTLGIFVLWLAEMTRVTHSVYLRIFVGSENLASNPVPVAFAVYLALIAAYLQVTAPSSDDGGYWYRRDKAIVMRALAAGVCVGGISVALQRYGLTWPF